MSKIALEGNASGTGTLTIASQNTNSNFTLTLPNETGNILTSTSAITAFPSTVGYRNVPPVGTQSGSYTLQTSDVGKYVQLTTGGSVIIPTSTFAEGDAVSIFNNTTGNITITCSAPTTYAAGINTVRTSLTLATRGVATVLFISATVCVVTGNVS